MTVTQESYRGMVRKGDMRALVRYVVVVDMACETASDGGAPYVREPRVAVARVLI